MDPAFLWRPATLDGAALLVGSILLKPVHLTTEKEWEEMLSINLTPAFHDVASAIAWLLDPDNDWVTGQILGLDGGLADLKAR